MNNTNESGNYASPKIIKFNESYIPPTSKLNPGLGIVEWGDKNNYPQYLLDLYNFYGSTTHKGIINRKVRMTSGQGFEDIIDPHLKHFVSNNDISKEIRKLSFDLEIFNGMSFEVIYDRLGENIIELNHVPFSKVRHGIIDREDENLSIPHFWISNDWTKARSDDFAPEYIREFDGTKEGRQLVYFRDYNPGDDGYNPVPFYSNVINWIELDYEISKFHLNQAKQGYYPSFILNMSQGIPNEDKQDQFLKGFKKNFMGTENSGKAIITYSEGKENAPEIIPLTLNDSDERFIMLMDQIEKYIVLGHEIPPQLLILTPGKLSATDERLALLHEFQVSYISPRQNIIEEMLNKVIAPEFSGEKLRLKKYQS